MNETTAMVKAESIYLMPKDMSGFEAVPQVVERYKMDKSGNFINHATDENLGNELKIAIISWQRQQILWKENKLGKILCIARDGKNPELSEDLDNNARVDLIDMGAGQYCETCPLKKFGEDGERPACSETVSIVAYDLERDVFFYISFSRTQVRNCYSHISIFRNKNRAPFAMQTTLSSKQKKNDDFTWFVPVFKLDKETLPEDSIMYFISERAALMQKVEDMDVEDIVVSDISDN